MKYRRKPDEVEAVQYTGSNDDEVAQLTGRGDVARYRNGSQLMIPFGGNTGVMIVSPGEWIVKRQDGNVTVTTDSVFREIWEETP